MLCLQEIKCRDGEFPAKAFKEAGYQHMHVVGQKGWHGVAIVSRVKLEPVEAPAICPKKEARIAAAKIDGVEVHNLYVPAGADVPELTNPKFAHKLKVLDRMKALYKKRKGAAPTVLVGDLNVAPGEHDVWSHKQLLERRLAHAGRDRSARTRCAIWAASSIWRASTGPTRRSSSPGGATAARTGPGTIAAAGSTTSGPRADIAAISKAEAFHIHVPCRSWERPSDHVPVVAGLKL